jgi:hypothetical protein
LAIRTGIPMITYSARRENLAQAGTVVGRAAPELE